MLKIFRYIENVFLNLKRSTRWFFRMWNNYDWDYVFLIEVMVHKMKDMRYQFDHLDADFVDLRHQPVGTPSSQTGACDEYEQYEDQLVGLDKAIELGEEIIKGDVFFGDEEDKKIKEFFEIIRDQCGYWWD